MDTKSKDISHSQANRRMVDELSSLGLITSSARDFALNLLYPASNWGLWTSRLLLVIGISLILSGIIYFFAFNWNKIPPEFKLISIQIAILCCIAGSYFYGLSRLPGKILLLSGSVLVGVFLAVFGQIYQTGADAYNLFMMWALLIFPWVLISEFAALWLLWIIVSKIFLILFWKQAVQPDNESEMMILSYLAVFTAAFTILREYFAINGKEWLQDRWTRIVLILPMIGYTIIPALMLILDTKDSSYSVVVGAVLYALIHCALYFIYRRKTPDILVLAATMFSGCIIMEATAFKALDHIFDAGDSLMYLLLGCLTIAIFSFAVIKLRVIAKEMEAKNV